VGKKRALALVTMVYLTATGYANATPTPKPMTGDVLFNIGESIISCPNGPAFEPSSFKLPCKIDEVVHPIYDIL
jgi:hypothetical protein